MGIGVLSRARAPQFEGECLDHQIDGPGGRDRHDPGDHLRREDRARVGRVADQRDARPSCSVRELVRESVKADLHVSNFAQTPLSRCAYAIQRR